VARAIATTHESSPPDLVFSVGDNFYEEGVESPWEPRLKLLFEYIYAGSFWDGIPFYATLGNHDHWGDPKAQVAYSAENPQWNMPGTHYAFQLPLSSRDSVLFLALDTDPISERRPRFRDQLAWADSILSVPAPGWVVAFGHHPVVSGGWHSVRGSFRKSMTSLLAERSHLYVAGHNHSTELIETESGPPQLVCGGGAGLDNPYRVEPVEGTLAAFTNGGWCLLHIQPDVLAIELYDGVGGLQYRHLLERTPVP
jgi:acid phosphatase